MPPTPSTPVPCQLQDVRGEIDFLGMGPTCQRCLMLHIQKIHLGMPFGFFVNFFIKNQVQIVNAPLKMVSGGTASWPAVTVWELGGQSEVLWLYLSAWCHSPTRQHLLKCFYFFKFHRIIFKLVKQYVIEIRNFSNFLLLFLIKKKTYICTNNFFHPNEGKEY